MQTPTNEQQPQRRFHWYNFSWQTVNYGVSGLFMILFWVFLARMWPQSTFGQFSMVFVWVSVYSLVTDLGLDFWVTRKTAIDRANAFPRALVLFKVSISLVVALGFVAGAYWMSLPLKAFVIFLLGAFLLNITHFFSCYLRGCEKLAVEAKISVVRNFTFMGCAVAGVIQGKGLEWVATGYTIASTVMALLTFIALKNSEFSISTQGTNLLVPLKAAFGVWITYLLVGLSVKLEIMMLGFLSDEQTVALYSASARIFEGGILLATAFVLTLFPALSQTSAESPRHYVSQVLGHAKLLLGLTLAAAVAGIVVGNWLFVYLYGQSYEASAGLFIKLMLVYPLSAQIYYLYNALVIAGKAKQVILVLALGVLLNLLLDWWFIPLWQIDGAFAGFAVKELVVLSMLLVLLARFKAGHAKTPVAGEAL